MIYCLKNIKYFLFPVVRRQNGFHHVLDISGGDSCHYHDSDWPPHGQMLQTDARLRAAQAQA